MECVYGQSAEARIDEETRKELIRFFKTGKPYDCPCAKIRQRWVSWLEKQGDKDKEILVLKDQVESLHAAIKAIKETYKIELEKQRKSNMGISEATKQKLEDNLNKALEKETPESWNKFLEQGEQKPTDKVEPKFKVGDLIVNNYCMGKVIELTDDAYLLDTEQGIPFSCEHNVHLWTIEDAKDGDVLACKDELMLFKFYENKNLCFYCWYNGQTNNFFPKDTHTSRPRLDIIVPATKEQRDLLFNKMKEAGYEWDAEKKELRKIEQEPYPETLDKAIDLYYYTYGNGREGFDHLSLEQFKDIVKTFVDDYGMQKSAWSEDDVYTAERLLCLLTNEQDNYPQLSCDFQEIEGIKDWVASLKDRVQPQPNQEWSKEDEEMLEDVSFNFMYNKGEMTDAMIAQYNRFFDKIKSLKPQPQQEWSEEDEKEVAVLEAYIHSKDWSDRHIDRALGIVDELVKKVKSRRPQNRWKPTDGELYVLRLAAEKDGTCLMGLYEQLKKLKEE